MLNKNFFTKTRWLVTIILLLAFTMPHAWAETITLTKTSLDIPQNYADNTRNATVGTVDFSYDKLSHQNNDRIQSQASNGAVWNTSCVPGKITNIAVNKESGTNRSSTLYWGTSAKATTNSTSISGSSSSNSPANSCFGYFYIKRGSNAAYWSSVVITYTLATITPSESSISGLDYNLGSGPSDAQSFTITGSNIPARLKITAPTDFEVKVGSSGSWGDEVYMSITLTGSATAGTPTAGDASTVYVRLKSGKSIGDYSGNVSIKIDNCNDVTGTTPKTVAVAGSVSAAGCSNYSFLFLNIPFIPHMSA